MHETTKGELLVECASGANIDMSRHVLTIKIYLPNEEKAGKL